MNSFVWLDRKENPKIGISRAVWSADSVFIATKSDQMPHNVWIWNAKTLKLHSVISLMQPVRNLQWDPVNARLALCSAENRVHMWSTAGISWVDIPVGKSPYSFASTGSVM